MWESIKRWWESRHDPITRRGLVLMMTVFAVIMGAMIIFAPLFEIR